MPGPDSDVWPDRGEAVLRVARTVRRRCVATPRRGWSPARPACDGGPGPRLRPRRCAPPDGGGLCHAAAPQEADVARVAVAVLLVAGVGQDVVPRVPGDGVVGRVGVHLVDLLPRLRVGDVDEGLLRGRRDHGRVVAETDGAHLQDRAEGYNKNNTTIRNTFPPPCPSPPKGRRFPPWGGGGGNRTPLPTSQF